MNGFAYNQVGHQILIHSFDQENPGRLIISFSEEVLNEDLESSPIVEMINQISEELSNGYDNCLRIIGDNEVHLTRRYGFHLTGMVHLENTKLVNPSLTNAFLRNVDLSTVKSVKIKHSTLHDVEFDKPIEVNNVDISFSQIVGVLYGPGDNRDNDIVMESNKINNPIKV